MCDFDICLRARTYFNGDKICLTLPKVPAPKVSMISYFEISCGYLVVDKCFELIFLDLV
jgi:hypothetical protein